MGPTRPELMPLRAVRLLRRHRKALEDAAAVHTIRLQHGCVREPVVITFAGFRWANALLRFVRQSLGLAGFLSRRRPLEDREKEALRQAVGVLQSELGRTSSELERALKRARQRIAFQGSPGVPTIGELYSDDWPIISLEYRRRVQFMCEECGCHAPDGHVHHMVPLSQGGTNHPSNLIFLCVAHHAAKHPHMIGVP